MALSSSDVLSGVFFLALIAALAKMYADSTMPKSYYSFTVNDRQVGRYENFEKCIDDEILYKAAHLEEHLSPYETTCDWH